MDGERSRALDHARRVVVTARARPGDHDHEIGAGRGIAHRLRERLRVVGDDRRAPRRAARGLGLRGEHQRVRVEDHPRRRLRADRPDLVARREHGDDGRAMDDEVDRARRGGGGDVDGAQPMAGGQQQLGGADVLADRAHVLVGRDRGAQLGAAARRRSGRARASPRRRSRRASDRRCRARRTRRARAKTGVLSLAPIVSAARTAMPSIAEASNDGDDRVAHTGSAVTRPTASCRPTRCVSTRAGQPAGGAGRAPGGQRLGGRDVADERRGGHGPRRGRPTPMCTGSRRPRSRPAGRWPRPVPTMYPSAAPSTDSRAEAPNSGVATPSRTATWTMSRRPAADGTSRSRRARRGRVGRRVGHAADEPHDAARRPGGRRPAPSAGFPAARSPGRRRSRRAASACPAGWRCRGPRSRASPGPATAAAVSSRAPTDDPADTTTTSLLATASRSTAARRSRSSGTMPSRSGSPPASRTSAASASARRVAYLTGLERRGGRVDDLVAGRHDRHPRPRVDRDLGHARRREQAEVLWRAGGVRRARGRRRARASSSRRTRPSPGATGRTTSIVPGIASCVYSTMTTASAPSGITPPVGIATAVPAATATSGARPIATAPATSRYAGQALGRPVRVGRADGVSVDGRSGEAGQVVRSARPALPGRARARPRGRPSRSPSDAQAGSPPSVSATVLTAKNSRPAMPDGVRSRCLRGLWGARAPPRRRGPCRAR